MGVKVNCQSLHVIATVLSDQVMQVDRGSVTSIFTLSGIVNFGDIN